MDWLSDLRRFFRPRRSAEKRTTWLSTEDDAALIEPCSGRVRALVEHDGYGKYYPILFVSPRRALQIILNHEGYVVSARCFPRLAVELVRYKADSMAEALQEIVEDHFGDA